MVSELCGGNGLGDTSGGAQGLLPVQCLRVAPCGTQGIRQYWGLSPDLLHAKPECSLFRTLGYDLEMALEGTRRKGGILGGANHFRKER